MCFCDTFNKPLKICKVFRELTPSLSLCLYTRTLPFTVHTDRKIQARTWVRNSHLYRSSEGNCDSCIHVSAKPLLACHSVLLQTLIRGYNPIMHYIGIKCLQQIHIVFSVFQGRSKNDFCLPTFAICSNWGGRGGGLLQSERHFSMLKMIRWVPENVWWLGILPSIRYNQQVLKFQVLDFQGSRIHRGWTLFCSTINPTPNCKPTTPIGLPSNSRTPKSKTRCRLT